MRGKRACERVACCKRVARLIYSDVVGWWRERDNYVKRAFWRNLPHFMPPPRQTASRRHYVFDLPVRPSVRPSVCPFVRLSFLSFICYETSEHDIMRMSETILVPVSRNLTERRRSTGACYTLFTNNTPAFK